MGAIYDDIIRGLSIDEVLTIQRVFMDLGYPCLDTGIWDYSTNESFIKFQRTHCLGTTEDTIKEIKKLYKDGAVG